MAEIERLMVTIPPHLAAILRKAMEDDGYDSISDVVEDVLRDWGLKRMAQSEASSALKADIACGLADVAEGRVHVFDIDRIIARGRRRFADRSPSA